MSNFKLNITDSTIGALAIGPGAEASSSDTPGPSNEPRLNLSLDIKNATPDRVRRVLYDLISRVQEPVTRNARSASNNPQGQVSFTIVRSK